MPAWMNVSEPVQGSPAGRPENFDPVKPGLHSYNIRRKVQGERHTVMGTCLHVVRLLLFVVGIGAVGYYGYTLSDQFVYQAYENWAFDQGLHGRHVGFLDWTMEATPLGGWIGYIPKLEVVPQQEAKAPQNQTAEVPKPIPLGSVLGRVDIPRLRLDAIVREGVDANTLQKAVGHVPSTQLAGNIGNMAIAAHRDTLFRGLKDIKIGDTVNFQSQDGTFAYRVISTQIVRPADVSVLKPQGDKKLLTMITCYPFYYVGSAPKRFIVTAQLADIQQRSDNKTSPPSTDTAESSAALSSGVATTAKSPPGGSITSRQEQSKVNTKLRNHRSFSRRGVHSPLKKKKVSVAPVDGKWHHFWEHFPFVKHKKSHHHDD